MDKSFRPTGAYGVVLTPFDSEGNIDIDALQKETEFLANSDIAGVFPCATTGEFIHLSPEENMCVMEQVTKQIAGRKKVTPGACASNLDTALLYAKKAADLGCDAIVVCSPYYITMPQSEIKEYFIRLAKAASFINIVLYNIPMFTSEISLEILQYLLQIKNIVAIKDSGQNMKRIAHTVDICRRARPDFAVLVGTDDMLVPALTGGCVGSMTAFSTILPEINSRIFSLFGQGKISEAQELNRSYLKLLRLADSLTFPAGYKLIMEKRGFKMGNKQVVSIYGTEAYRKIENEIETELKLLNIK